MIESPGKPPRCNRRTCKGGCCRKGLCTYCYKDKRDDDVDDDGEYGYDLDGDVDFDVDVGFDVYDDDGLDVYDDTDDAASAPEMHKSESNPTFPLYVVSDMNDQDTPCPTSTSLPPQQTLSTPTACAAREHARDAAGRMSAWPSVLAVNRTKLYTTVKNPKRLPLASWTGTSRRLSAAVQPRARLDAAGMDCVGGCVGGRVIRLFYERNLGDLVGQ